MSLSIIMLLLLFYEPIELEVTAYSPMDNRSGICADSNPNVTATGTKPRLGTVAVNPKVIPYGTKMFIPGYGWGVAEDTGGMIRAREDLIDIVLLSYDEAIRWGRRTKTVWVERRVL